MAPHEKLLNAIIMNGIAKPWSRKAPDFFLFFLNSPNSGTWLGHCNLLCDHAKDLSDSTVPGQVHCTL
jgi:hypothetical protein